MSYYLPFDPSIKRGQGFGDNPGWGPNPAGGHNGDDWLTPIGTPVRAPGDGVVVYAGRFDATYADNWGWNINYAGPMVILNMDGDTGPYFEFGHLSALRVQTGQRVTGGQIVALTGADDGGTGVITGPHCHVGCLPPNFNLGTNTYGRVNPRIYMTKYWDGINLANSGTITPLEEDDMALFASIEDFKAAVAEAVEPIARVTRVDTATNVLNKQVPHKDPITGKDDGTPTTLATMVGYFDFQAVQTRLAKSSPQEIVNLIPEALVKAVLDGLAKRLQA